LLSQIIHSLGFFTQSVKTPARSASEGKQFAIPRLRFGLVKFMNNSGDFYGPEPPIPPPPLLLELGMAGRRGIGVDDWYFRSIKSILSAG